MNYYRKIKDKEHIFIYAVCGRCGSTALQRIFNSSNEIIICGEPHYIVDKIIGALKTLDDKDAMFERSYKSLKLALSRDNHSKFYPNALADRNITRNMLINTLSNLFKPPKNINLERNGFKEIRIQSMQTLEYLSKLFPNSKVLFLFRNPLYQWNSVKKTKQWWITERAHRIDSFLNDYIKFAEIYLQFAKDYKKPYFIEYNKIKNTKNIEKLLSFCNINSFDENLIDDAVESTKKFTLTEVHKKNILNSKAYQKYLEMKKISDDFLKP